MDTPSPPHLHIPRLRLIRNSTSPQPDDTATPTAGPSRLASINPDVEEDDDMQSTPRMSATVSITPEGPSPYATSPQDTPAARLRAILARTPYQKPLANETAPAPPSELDSDFDPPRFSPATPSIAQESLKDIFSRALRDPGDTPRKGRRRNSIDVSEVEASPRAERERAKNKGKRRSLSDEEVDKSKTEQRLEGSFRSSQAATFDILRERLTNSNGKPKNQPTTTSLHDYTDTGGLSDAPGDASHELFMRYLNSSPGTPPAATSTPQRSLQMPSQLQFESNLLEQDSEMHRALKGLDSYEGDSGRNQRSLSFPPARASPPRTSSVPHASPARPHSAAHSKSYSHDKTHNATYVHTRRGSEDLDRSSSRASSSLSNNEYERDRIREREREWNKPHPKQPTTPDLHHRHSHGSMNGGSSRSGSPHVLGNGHGQGLSRRGSAASLSDMSSRNSSYSSQAEYQERMSELQQERNAEREREWNKPHSKLNRSSSSLSMNSSHSPTHTRTRTLSHPKSPSSLLTPDHPSLHRHRSHSPAFLSRTSSPNGSMASQDSWKDQVEEVKHEIVHERERNWNAPQPKWQHPGHRSVSPIPPSLSSSSPHPHSHSKVRMDGLKSPSHEMTGRSLRASASHSSLQVADKTSLSATSPQPRPNSSLGKQTRPVSYPARPNSPLPPTLQETEYNGESLNGNPGTNSRFGWTLPRSRAQLPPLELDHSPERSSPGHARAPSSPTPSSRPSSRASEAVRPSQIPVRSPKKSAQSSNFVHPKGHKRTTTELSEPAGGIPPRVNVEQVVMNNGNEYRGPDSVLASDEESPSPMGTPIVRPIPPPGNDETDTVPRPLLSRVSGSRDEARLQNVITPPATQSLSPPPTPPSVSPPPSQPIFSLETPPRRPSFNTSKLEFQTPSPPKGMPDLPGPPSSSEDEKEPEKEVTPKRVNGDLTSLKTPKPPGAWATTPRHDAPDSLSDTAADPLPEGINGMATEVNLTVLKTPKAPGAWSTTPVPPHRGGLTRTLSLLDESEDSRSENGLATPVASLSRANLMPLETPAPPGAWASTPSSAKRKSILKVRFDVETAESDSTLPEAAGVRKKATSESIKMENAESARTNGVTLYGTQGGSDLGVQTPELPATPVSGPSSPRPLRKSPSIRVVDAFGREHGPKDSGATVKEDEKEIGISAIPNKSAIRIVDAMGREVEEVNESKAEDVHLTHNEALVHIRTTISELNEGMNNADRSSDDTSLEERRFRELEDISRISRDVRKKLTQTLRMSRESGSDPRSQYGPLKQSKFLTSSTNRRLWWLQTNSFVFWGIVSVHIIFIIAMYRMSISNARHIFLTTYYDPFNPELYIHITHPNSLRYATSSSAFSDTPSWSFFTAYDTLQRDGWKALASGLWSYFVLLIRDWQAWLWDYWGDYHGHDRLLWPPT